MRTIFGLSLPNTVPAMRRVPSGVATRTVSRLVYGPSPWVRLCTKR